MTAQSLAVIVMPVFTPTQGYSLWLALGSLFSVTYLTTDVTQVLCFSHFKQLLLFAAMGSSDAQRA